MNDLSSTDMYLFILDICKNSALEWTWYAHTYVLCIHYSRYIVQVKDEADKVPKLQEQIQELSAKVTQSEDKEKSLDEELEKNKSEIEEKKKEIDELHEKLKVCF